MKFYKDLYCESHLQHKRKSIKWKLKHTKLQLNIYIIIIGEYGDQLEIFHDSFLRHDYYRDHPPVIIGIADSKEGAFRVVEQLVQVVYEQTGEANIKKYLIDNK